MTLPLVSSPLTRIGLIGESMVELRTQADGQLAQAFGGDTLNAAVYLRRLLEDGEVQVDYLTAVGDDTLSQAMRARWREEGVSDERVRVLPGRLPGLYLIQTDADGERRFLYWRGEAAARGCFYGGAAQPPLAAAAGCDVRLLRWVSLAVRAEYVALPAVTCLRNACVRHAIPGASGCSPPCVKHAPQVPALCSTTTTGHGCGQAFKPRARLTSGCCSSPIWRW